MAVIEDARVGFTAKVTAENRLGTTAIVSSQASHASIHGDYYAVCNKSGHTAEQGWLLDLKNDSDSLLLLIHEIHISSSADGSWHLGYGGEVSSGSDVTPVNMNLGSAKQAPVIAKYGTPLVYSINPSRLFGGFMTGNSKYVESVAGALVLHRGNSIALRWYGTGTTAFGIQFYMFDRSRN